MVHLRGITWDHPRGYTGLEAATAAYSARTPGVQITWERHSLHHFESHPIRDLAARYDLIVLDHPAMGDVAQVQCLVNLADHAGPLDLPELEADTVGPSLASYAYAGGLWALPVDAACQVAAYRPDLLAKAGVAPPRTLDEVHDLSRHGRLALALGGVHGFMVFLTLCANLGSPLQAPPAPMLADPSVGVAALETLRALAASCPPEALDWNSIAALDALHTRDDLLYSPYVYGFSSYSATERPLAFTGIPAGADGSTAGSVIGGTGLAISRHCVDLAAALTVARHLTSAPVQLQMGLAGGQPARRTAWLDPVLNARYLDFYVNTLPVIDASWMRPRYAGYVAFQSVAGEIVTDFLRRGASPTATLAHLDAAQRRAVAGQAGGRADRYNRDLNAPGAGAPP
ncbi:MAG: extracellular solute-binding protein [Thermomicrobiales bacterium]|nr:extracellular solute-binding protein [Thermomicrobiales bacterium]